MKCNCGECQIEFEYEYKVSICNECLLEYNGKEFDVICNKCKKIIKTIKRSFTQNNFTDVLRNCLKKEDYCKKCNASVA